MKQKRVVNNKEELVEELKGNVKFQEKLKFTKEQFYPALIKASKSIDDATSFLSSINTVLMQDFIGKMKEVKMSDMKLVEKLDPTDEKYEELKEMLALFDEMNAFDAKDLLEGMRSEIQLFITDEMQERTLESLKTKWIM